MERASRRQPAFLPMTAIRFWVIVAQTANGAPHGPSLSDAPRSGA